MEISKLPVYSKARLLTLQIVASTNKVPKDFRYTFVRDLLKDCMELMRRISFANYYLEEPEKREAFIVASLESIQELKVSVRVMFDLNLISKKGFAAISRKEAEVSRQLNGWLKQTREKNFINNNLV